MRAKLLVMSCLLSSAVTLGAGASWAQPVPPPPDELAPVAGETVDLFTARAQTVAEGNAKKTKLVAEEAKAEIEKTTAKAIAQKPTTTTPPPAFADRVNTAIADFLPLFQFAVNDISSSADKTSVTAKFNPIPVGIYGNLSLTATAAQPEVFAALKEKIVEPAREAQGKNLLGKVDDFSDLTFAASYGLQRRAGTWANTRKLFGRSYELYRNLASALLAEALAVPLEDPEQASDRVKQAQHEFIRSHRPELDAAAAKDNLSPGDFGGTKLDTIKSVAPAAYEDLVKLLRQQAQVSADVTAAVQKAILDNKLDALPAMIDNQPQLVLQGSYRARNEILGPDTMAITANYEVGSRNFNAALREYHQMIREGNPAPSYLEAYRRGVTSKSYMNEDKLILSASFRRNQDYTFSYDYKDSVSVPGSTAPVEISRTASLTLPRSNDWRASLTWTRLWPRRTTEKPGNFLSELPTGLELPQVTGRQDPRTTLSIEWVNADQSIKVNGTPVENDRFVARLSMVIPVQGGMTLPLTIVYSDKPEFLKGQDRILSAHVGISYKIGDKGTAAAAGK